MEANLPPYVSGALRNMLDKPCARNRGYTVYPDDVPKMCQDKALFYEVLDAAWNKTSGNRYSCAMNTYRDRVLVLPRLRKSGATNT